MKFQKGNKAGEVWTKELAIKFFQELLEYVQENEKCRSMATATSKLGQYETLPQYLKKRFELDNNEFEPIKKIQAILKGRLIEQGLDNAVNNAMAIFVLKNDYDMSDKVTNENRNYDQPAEDDSVNLENLSEDELIEFENLMNKAKKKPKNE